MPVELLERKFTAIENKKNHRSERMIGNPKIACKPINSEVSPLPNKRKRDNWQHHHMTVCGNSKYSIQNLKLTKTPVKYTMIIETKENGFLPSKLIIH